MWWTYLRIALFAVATAAAIYRYGLSGWLARQQPWEWIAGLLTVAVFVGVLSIKKVRKATAWFTIAWFAGGLGATAGCAWLCWRTWNYPSDRNWYAIPLIGILAICSIFVFWIPLLASFRKSSKLIGKLETAIDNSDPNAPQYLWEARQAVGTGDGMDQAYLDALEGRLHLQRGEPDEAVDPLRRAVIHALTKDDLVLGSDAGPTLIRLLVSLSREEEASELAVTLEETWGKMPEVEQAFHS